MFECLIVFTFSILIIVRYEGALDPWMSTLWSTLYQRNPRLLPNAINPDDTLMDQPKVQVIYHDTEEGSSPTTTNAGC